LYRRSLQDLPADPGMKTMDTLGKLFLSADRSGVYAVTGKTTAVESAGRKAGLSVLKLDVGKVKGKTEVLNSLGKTLKFPKHFGQNWDALHDFLTDFSWQKANGWIVVLLNAKPFADRYTADFETAVDVLRAAADHWRGQGKPFWVLAQGNKNWNAGLPM